MALRRSGRRQGVAESRREQIQRRAVELLESDPNGLRYTALVQRIQDQLPQIPTNTIRGAVWNLDSVVSDKVYKASRGVFRAVTFRESEATEPVPQAPTATQTAEEELREEQFYEPFADWITGELEECTKAVPLGGNRFKDKWGTPDVLGIREPKKSDILKPPTEIVAAELKIEKSGLIVAFGQACAYKLFSHRSYIVVPNDSAEEDVARLDVLCRTLGVGLILFDATSPQKPNFEIRVRAARHEPDMFYVNKYMKLVEDELFS
jgi:hypothetical protein